MTTETTVGENNPQNNATSNINTGGEYFLHFETVGVNPFGRFGTFGGGNNNSPSENNNNNNLPLLLPPGFGVSLGEGFNPPSEGNAGRLDPNIAALVNTLTGANLGINHAERESNHIKLTEFGRIEVEDPNE